jgi:hypothetical protein
MEQKLATKAVEETSGLIADGIHLGLDEERYHLDDALGSSDHKKLMVNPSDFWFESTMNPNRPADKDTPARLRGRAMHKLVLEGPEPFALEYMRGPDKTDDLTSAEKSAATKKANLAAEKLGLTILPAEVYDRVLIASAMITRNPKLATAFHGGIPEVSIFWTRDGIRRKARIDYLKPRGIGDLKSIVNTRELPFPAACRNAIATYRYEVQAALYIEARGMLPQLVDENRIFVHSGDPDLSILYKCAETKAFAFQWIFFQSDKAPITWSSILSPANPIFEIGRRGIETASDNYLEFMRIFGRNNMWLLLEDPQELAIDELPAWWARN